MTKATHNLGIKVTCIFLVMITGMTAFFSIVGILFAGESGIFSDHKKSYYDTPWCENTTYSYSDNVVRWYLDGATPEEIAQIFSNGKTNFSYELYDYNGALAAKCAKPETIGLTTSYAFYYYEGRDAAGNYTHFDNPVAYTVVAYVSDPLTASDNYWLTYRLYTLTMSLGYWLFLIALVSLLILAASLIYLLCAAGHRNESEEIVLNVQDRIPLDIYLLLWYCVVTLVTGILSSGAYYGNLDISRMMAVFFGLFTLEAFFLALLLTVSTRLKKGGWWKNALLYFILKFLWRICKAIFSTIGDAIHALPAIWKVVVSWLVVSSFYLSSTYAPGMTMLLNFILLIVFCSIAAQWQKLSRAGKQLSAGNLEYKVDTRRMFRSFRQHGNDLNNISEGIAIALNQKMKSERLRTELITNVSHDIKTPLTSIINYVDLLKKEALNGQASVYVEVLDRQSHRLKKLTEDLVEASKASTGNLHCALACTDIVELVQQSVGEYEEKLAAAQLEAIINAPENEIIYGLVDGNLMWRVLSNLLSNACKYSQPNTRVYLQVKQNADQVFITVKNVSRDQLNIDPDELMERFVRGDSSRSTEGSGLGLNIARSLVELQKGKFTLSIDGDLFKAQVRFARAFPPEANTQLSPPEPQN